MDQGHRVQEPLRVRHYCPETIEQQAVQTFESSTDTPCQVAAPLWANGVAALPTIQLLLRFDVSNAACVSEAGPNLRPCVFAAAASFSHGSRRANTDLPAFDCHGSILTLRSHAGTSAVTRGQFR